MFSSSISGLLFLSLGEVHLWQASLLATLEDHLRKPHILTEFSLLTHRSSLLGLCGSMSFDSLMKSGIHHTATTENIAVPS